MSLGDRVLNLSKRIKQYVDFLYPVYVPTYTPKTVAEYTFDDIYNVVMRSGDIGRPDYWQVLDNRYWVTTVDDFREIVSRDWTKHRRYIDDRFDCDNFALHFVARINAMYGLNSVGIVIDYDAAHAYNLAIVIDGGNLRKVVIEPQTGEILYRPDGNLHKLQNWVLIM
ncbi:hypothetical protein PFV2_gp39 [Pyrobaculum filamentous virus 2]|uniref:Agglutinin C-terminal domain-containing protein n=1 Tax=Pyrobaculum filamentous virus 2 TaxID=2730621 RepID=A0A6M3VYW3_PFV2|nr:hypothetical protein QIT34_gp39 [Pyrobaculum filamentous virus 2]QJF12412.1 hypothetical protein PFV2_gp39 [Pyrobaculum filamentous virus 2]